MEMEFAEVIFGSEVHFKKITFKKFIEMKDYRILS
jgi:hypothetical protein